jgi:5'-AMP-activated protein kinase regulatory beta subunit
MLRLPPGQYRLKFIVDDSWRCSKQIATATDDDGTLVNWLEVEAPKSEAESKAEWAMDAKPAINESESIILAVLIVADESDWTQEIPDPLVLYQYLEELPNTFDSRQALDNFYSTCPYISPVPVPPTLPRILERVIVNAEPRKQWDDSHLPGWSNGGIIDDNSILSVPNHVVLNHLTASAIKNGTLGVGTTTRYRKKVRVLLSSIADASTLQPCFSNPPHKRVRSRRRLMG